jgi:hypothetical protein
MPNNFCHTSMYAQFVLAKFNPSATYNSSDSIVSQTMLSSEAIMTDGVSLSMFT